MTDSLADWREACERDVLARWPDETVRLVFGDGNADSPPLMLVGEAPGEQETLQGKPFVGKAGKNLNAFLSAVGLTRAELYVSNVVKYRPTRTSNAGRTVNRPPTPAEVRAFIPWLWREVALIRPRALVTLGNVALNAFLPMPQSIGECHGQWQTVSLKALGDKEICVPLFALYHPAAVIYRRELLSVYEADVATLQQSLPTLVALSDS